MTGRLESRQEEASEREKMVVRGKKQTGVTCQICMANEVPCSMIVYASCTARLFGTSCPTSVCVSLLRDCLVNVLRDCVACAKRVGSLVSLRV